MDNTLKEMLLKCGCKVQDEFMEIPFFWNGAHCGDPEPLASEEYEMVRVVKCLTRYGAMFCLEAHGDSMTGAGIEDGDLLLVRQQRTASDGDIMLVIVGGDEVMVKNYVEDEYGDAWLVPSNDKYEPRRVDDDCLFAGRVMKVEKQIPRASRGACMQAIRRVRPGRGQQAVSQQQLSLALKRAQGMIKNKRQWFAVYRALVDCNTAHPVVKEKDFAGFYALLHEVMGDEAPELNLSDLRRMDILSMARPLERWDADNSPVAASRFYDYLSVGREVLSALR